MRATNPCQVITLTWLAFTAAAQYAVQRATLGACPALALSRSACLEHKEIAVPSGEPNARRLDRDPTAQSRTASSASVWREFQRLYTRLDRLPPGQLELHAPDWVGVGFGPKPKSRAEMRPPRGIRLSHRADRVIKVVAHGANWDVTVAYAVDTVTTDREGRRHPGSASAVRLDEWQKYSGKWMIHSSKILRHRRWIDGKEYFGPIT